MTAKVAEFPSVRELAPAFLAMAAIFTLLLGWSWLRSRDMERLALLPAPTRQEVYERTFANVRAVCAGPDARRFEAFCRGQAETLEALPECDAGCVALARSILVYPTR